MCAKRNNPHKSFAATMFSTVVSRKNASNWFKNFSNDNSVRPVSADAWGWRSPNPPGISRRLLVSDCHIPECICRMARPIVFWAQTDTALLVLTLVVVAERVAASFSRRVIKPASRKNAPRRFYAHHRGAGSGILDRNAAIEAGFGPVIDVTLARDVVRRHAVVR